MNTRWRYIPLAQTCQSVGGEWWAFVVRVLLGAIRCEKGDIGTNLTAHSHVLEEAGRARVDAVVFPEMSLTGSVDPLVHPERLVTADGPEVAALLDATKALPAVVVFGIGERDGDDAFITQCVARQGALIAIQRKRYLGEGEEAFAVGTRTETFDHAGARMGVMICAESRAAFVVDAIADAGARVVLFCAAPGLTGRRDDDAAFADGLAWWESAGLADAQRHARRRGVWIALATQAGATVDEDFPGLAALVSPTGALVARTPDWRPATLVVDVPL
jgi:predicted amidohydrolase